MPVNCCLQCGASLHEADSYCAMCFTEAEPLAPYLVSVQRVVLLTVLSGGLYLFWWFYITWKQYRDHTGEKAFPVWHALTLVVPIYSFFRIHDHFRTYKDLMTGRQLTSSISPGGAVAAVFFSNCLGLISFVPDWSGVETSEPLKILISFALSTGFLVWLLAPAHFFSNCLGLIGFVPDWSGVETSEPLKILISFALSTGLLVWLLAPAQMNISKYWTAVFPRCYSSRISVGEAIVTSIGFLFWGETFATTALNELLRLL